MKKIFSKNGNHIFANCATISGRMTNSEKTKQNIFIVQGELTATCQSARHKSYFNNIKKKNSGKRIFNIKCQDKHSRSAEKSVRPF
jgi:hypothetical protein